MSVQVKMQVEVQSFDDYCDEMDKNIATYKEQKKHARMFSHCPFHPLHTNKKYIKSIIDLLPVPPKMEWRNDAFHITFTTKMEAIHWLNIMQLVFFLKADEVTIYSLDKDSLAEVRLWWD